MGHKLTLKRGSWNYESSYFFIKRSTGIEPTPPGKGGRGSGAERRGGRSPSGGRGLGSSSSRWALEGGRGRRKEEGGGWGDSSSWSWSWRKRFMVSWGRRNWRRREATAWFAIGETQETDRSAAPSNRTMAAKQSDEQKWDWVWRVWIAENLCR